MAKLTEKQKRFCDYYIETCNATESYKRAGYSWGNDNVAGVEANKLLKNPKIRGYIDEFLGNMGIERVASAEEILEYWTRVMRREEFDVTVVQEQKPVIGDDGKKKGYETVSRSMDIPPSIKDRNKASEMLAKIYGLDKQRETKEAGGIEIIW